MTSPLITQVTRVCLVELCLWLTDLPLWVEPFRTSTDFVFQSVRIMVLLESVFFKCWPLL